jgi:acetyl esterase/lipase
MVRGKKNREALPLLYRLASQGWMCISANYRLSPAATFPAQLIDAKKVIAWVRAHGKGYGADTSTVFVAGGSAGAQLASQAALTPNDPKLQPGFESADTSVAAVIALYGYFGWMGGEFLQQITDSRKEIPPFFILHGEQDTLLPVEGARHFVQKLRSISRNPVVYAEIPDAQHNFDLFHSVRNEAVVDGIETFAAWVRAKYGTQA